MFSGLRQNSLIYILEKGENINLKIGQVTGISNPQPAFKTSFQPGQMGIENTVDVTAKVKDDTLEFKKLPANQSIHNYISNGIVVSDNREAMCAEVEAMLCASRQIIESIPYHEKAITIYDDIMRQLNPQFAKEKEHEEKIGALEGKMNGIEDKLNNILGLLSKSIDNNTQNSKAT